MITVERSGHVATVWLDRPEKLNAMAPEFWTALPETMAKLGDDAEVRAIVIAARGKAFSVGIDLEAFGPALLGGTLGGEGSSEASKRQALLAEIRKMQLTMTSVAACPHPVIAAVHGYCLGGGLDLATACDIRLAAVDAIFSVRETKLAMVADVGTLQRLPRIVNPGLVADWVYTGRDFTATEALGGGLVSRIYPSADEVQQAALDLATEIAANSPLAVRGSKAILGEADGKTIDEALQYAALWNAAFLESNDIREAIAAYLEKRPPEFTGT
jgi:enoyl-CoA hydratase